MRSTWIAAGAGVLLLAGLTTVHAVASPDDETERPAAVSRADKDHKDGKGGPPPWAHARKHRDGDDAKQEKERKSDHAWKDGWKAMTPAERQELMRELAREHSEAMRAFATCMAEAEDDPEARAECEKPIPLGHAKRGEGHEKPGRRR